MIITRLNGGLGNQLFQYAIGRKMSFLTKEPLAFDISAYDVKGVGIFRRDYSLSHFNTHARVLDPKESAAARNPYGIFSRISRGFREKVLRRFHAGYEPEILEKRGPMYLEGFWQSERYFLDIRPVILEELTLKDGFSPEAKKVADMMADPALLGDRIPVSLHVRRGDYAYSEATKKHHGLMGQEYYSKALRYVAENAPRNPGGLKVFVFSDDIVWVKENIKVDHDVFYVSELKLPDYEEMRLMSLCRHHVIANSTFSWWGAWLDTGPDKIVVAPQGWVVGNILTPDEILPPSWIRM